MPSVTRYFRMLMLVFVTIFTVVPGGLAMTVCFCPDAPTLPGQRGGSCGMVCCEVAHEPAPQDPRIAKPTHKDCGACRTLTTGKREASLSAPAGLEFSHVALPAVHATPVVPPRVILCERPSRLCGSRGPPGKFASVPLRI